VEKLFGERDLKGLYVLIEALAGNVSSFTAEIIRQRLEDGSIDVESLPKHIKGD